MRSTQDTPAMGTGPLGMQLDIGPAHFPIKVLVPPSKLLSVAAAMRQELELVPEQQFAVKNLAAFPIPANCQGTFFYPQAFAY